MPISPGVRSLYEYRYSSLEECRYQDRYQVPFLVPYRMLAWRVQFMYSSRPRKNLSPSLQYPSAPLAHELSSLPPVHGLSTGTRPVRRRHVWGNEWVSRAGSTTHCQRPVLVHTTLCGLPRVGGRLVTALDVSIWLHKLGSSVDPLGVVVDKDYSETIKAIVGCMDTESKSSSSSMDGASSVTSQDGRGLESGYSAQRG